MKMGYDSLKDLQAFYNTLNSEEFELVSSFNSQNCVTPETKLIIVGTITPPSGCKAGYFYSAPRNRIYGYIDEARGSNLKNKKVVLNNERAAESDKTKAVEDIIAELKSERIAFLDVIQYAVRKKGSHADKDIKSFVLDCSSFEKLHEGVKVICNSRMAHKCYRAIGSKLSSVGIKLPEAVFVSQRSATKEKWINEINEIK